MVELWSPESYKRASANDLARFANGCGPAGWHRQLRPLILFLGFGWTPYPACQIHDWMYSGGVSLADKQEADRVFLNNMLRLVDGGSRWWRPWRRVLAMSYYDAVVALGGPPFWDGDKLPPDLRKTIY